MVDETSDKIIIEVPVLKEKTSKDFRKDVVQRREEIAGLIKDAGFFRVRKLTHTLAEKYNVSDRMILYDFDWIKGHIRPVDIREIKIDLSIGRSKAYSDALDLLFNAKDSDIKIKAIGAVITAGRFYREELEAWGEKDKIAEKSEIIMNKIPVFNIIVENPEREKDIVTEKDNKA